MTHQGFSMCAMCEAFGNTDSRAVRICSTILAPTQAGTSSNSAQVTGVGDSRGVVLVEIYEVP